MIDVLNKVSPQMKERAQEEDFDISQVLHYVKAGKKLTLAQIKNIKAKTVQKYLYQFVWLVFWQEVLCRTYKQEVTKYHQLMLPIEFRAQFMELLHDQQGY